MDLNQLRDDVYAWAQDKGWWEKPEDRHIGSKIALIHSEASEALEEFREGRMETYYSYKAGPEDATHMAIEMIAGDDGKLYAQVAPGRRIEMTHERWLDIGYLAKPEGFPSELADIIIRVVDLAGFLDIDLNEAVRLKMEYNATREYRHGGKAI